MMHRALPMPLIMTAVMLSCSSAGAGPEPTEDVLLSVVSTARAEQARVVKESPGWREAYRGGTSEAEGELLGQIREVRGAGESSPSREELELRIAALESIVAELYSEYQRNRLLGHSPHSHSGVGGGYDYGIAMDHTHPNDHTHAFDYGGY